jgi:hypothetical protein
MRALSLAVAVALMSSPAFAQTSAPRSTSTPGRTAPAIDLATPAGNEVHVSVGGYNYEEPGDLAITIHGPKFGFGYLGTLPINRNHHWFAQVDGRGTIGNVTYDGWCAPFFISPDSTSPNGYFLDLGDYSRCSESGDNDWYLETRGLIGKDFIGGTWAFSPDTGVGFRHLSNGTAGINGYRTDKYLYVPAGITARRRVGARSALSFNAEYDYLIHGWQKTRDSQLGGGDVPATSTAPAFTINGFSDVSFDQPHGWGVRVSAKYNVTPRWSIEPAYIHWNIHDSEVSFETVTFTVNGIAAQEQFGAVEPLNNTDEFAVRLGFHF